MPNLFSHPAFPTTDSYQVVGYNLVKSTAVSNGPSYYGPWNAVTGYTGYTNNLDIVDPSGTQWDLYRVQPIIALNGTGTQYTLDFSRPFYRDTPLYDNQISALLDSFRRGWLDDIPVRQTDSTVITESTGSGASPFVADSNTYRYYLSFLPNTDPIKFNAENILIYSGSNAGSATPLTPYSDFFPQGQYGYVDFKVNPSAGSYLRAEFDSFNYSNDECRNLLINAVSSLSHYQINGFAVSSSWNYYYLQVPLLQRDLGEIVCCLAKHNLLGAQLQASFQTSEEWKDGKGVEFSTDPSRSTQAGVGWHTDLSQELRERCNSYIVNNRQYFSRGEFDSFFDNSGILIPPWSVQNPFAYVSWWL